MLKALQVCFRRQVWRSFSTARGGRPQRRAASAAERAQTRTCTVDPNLEEQFFFMDWTDLQEDPHQEEAELLHQLMESLAGPGPSPDAPPKHLRSVERQLQLVRGRAQQEAELDFLQFQDTNFPLDKSLIKSQRKKKQKNGGLRVFGTPDKDVPIGDTCCSGCGALLHCFDPGVPGYLPSEKYKVLLQEGDLGGATCQRCHLITHRQKALDLQMSRDQYRDVVQQVRTQKALVLLLVDLLDLPGSIIPDLPHLVGTNKPVVVMGNKVDLLPPDAPNYLQRIKRQLHLFCQDAGFGPQVRDVHLISAKTGYGVENLVSHLLRSWRYSGDVYLVGGANTGKSTLFNMLLESDYCRSKTTNQVHKATISPWPGTTLNLLKFPIINPTSHKMLKRQERLKEAEQQEEAELPLDELKRLKQLSRNGYLVGRVGRTFCSTTTRSKEIQFDPESLAFGEEEERNVTTTAVRRSHDKDTNELKDAHWFYDTPGILKERDILQLLQDQEVRLVVPTQAIVPRTFVLKPRMCLFVGALARIDFLEGGKSCWFSVLVSNQIPVHVTSLDRADAVYEKHAGHALLGVPVGGSERMKQFPSLVPEDVCLQGRGYLDAAADITLSSAGWVAVTAMDGDQVQLRVHGPAAAGFGLRTSPLLPHVVSLKGQRVHQSAAYRPVKVAGTLDRWMDPAAHRTQVHKKKKKKK